MGHIYLVRSGQASFGSAHYDQLSSRGHEQARLLGQWFARLEQPFHHALSGGMARHAQTAQACLAQLPAALKPPHDVVNGIVTDTGFAEFDHHEVFLRHCPDFADPAAFAARLASHAANGNPQHALEQLFRAAMQRWMTGWHDDQYTETWPDFRSRVVAALERLDRPDSGQATIVFTSSGVIATVMQHLLGLQDVQVMEMAWKMANGSVTQLLHRPGELSVGYLNSYAHLQWLGGPELVSYR